MPIITGHIIMSSLFSFCFSFSFFRWAKVQIFHFLFIYFVISYSGHKCIECTQHPQNCILLRMKRTVHMLSNTNDLHFKCMNRRKVEKEIVHKMFVDCHLITLKWEFEIELNWARVNKDVLIRTISRIKPKKKKLMFKLILTIDHFW